MGKIAVVFPGQGAQKVGMASDLYNEEERSTRVLNLAQETVDFDLLETMFTDNDGKLGETENTQPALLTHSVALLESLNHLKSGDVIIFHQNSNNDFIKRLIGKPGDQIEYKNDKLYINKNYVLMIPLTFIFGATLLLISDVLCRLITYPFESPVGIVTSFVGAFYFLFITVRGVNRI